ncbi:zinc finger CCCH domain-containing protein 8 [Culicoides brevitarsis]|uniref:zinc finger CCCH domain-containing protein 8 n=1 Tax=Culicoides brevitarsis TaxID=469753 RepID=UPI00307C1375
MSFLGLVADYGSSEEDSEQEIGEKIKKEVLSEDPSDTSSENDEENDEKESKQKVTMKLPSAADLLGASSSQKVHGGVLTNKYKLEEDQKIANLERHVKMVNTDLNTKTKNGKKICWSYRKGRCRFGSSCTFAHDSDVQTSSSTASGSLEEPKSTKRKSSETEIEQNRGSGVKKKRPGLSNTLIPGKKVVQMYKNLKNS